MDLFVNHEEKLNLLIEFITTVSNRYEIHTFCEFIKKEKPQMKLCKNLNLARTILITGFALWITLCAINNLTDRGTNLHLLSLMFSMEEIIADPLMGSGLEWRALPGEPTATLILWGIIAYQILNSMLLWRASVLYINLMRFPLHNTKRRSAQRAANMALIGMMIEWMFFFVWRTIFRILDENGIASINAPFIINDHSYQLYLHQFQGGA